jgi:hypothetical protein
VYGILQLDQPEHDVDTLYFIQHLESPAYRQHKLSFRSVGSREGVEINSGRERAVSCNAKKAANFTTFNEF